MKKALYSPFLLSMALSLTLTGCHPNDDNASSPGDTVNADSVATCDRLSATFTPGALRTGMRSQFLQIERQSQRLIHRDCHGRVLADATEIKNVSRDMNLNFRNPSNRPFKAVFVYNRNSCVHQLTQMPARASQGSANPSISGDGWREVNLNVDLGNGNLAFGLQEGNSMIYAEFYYDCTPRNVGDVVVGTPDCDESRDRILTASEVRVNLTNRTLPVKYVDANDGPGCHRGPGPGRH